MSSRAGGTVLWRIAASSLVPALVWAADTPGSRQPSEAIFVCQIVLLILVGRLAGELMQRIGQPTLMGQLIAGILLGPSVFGAWLPDLQHALFPADPAQKAMLDAVSQIGILLLLLLTGMETDLSVVRHCRRAAFTVSIMGIAIPFACGIVLGRMLPDAVIQDPGKRLITTLFLGTALSISSVKIVALLVRELGFLRRTVGQVIVASAIIDDTIGWIVISVIFGLALHGTIDLQSVARGVLGTIAFLVLSFTVGRRAVFILIRWSNDRFVSELPVISMILVIMGAMALITHAIGVHTVLGAFVAGILVGQSPILTRHIDEQLRGLIVALFMPVFFGMAGLSTDVRVLAHSELLTLTAIIILVASLGKFSGALLGGRIGGLSFDESLAVGCGMNARGSTEIIIATFGLTMGALSQSLFTSIVAMAVITTVSMPPMLRWAFQRLPVEPTERERLDREQAEAGSFFKGVERVLVAVDSSRSGALATHLTGLLAVARGMPATALHMVPAGTASSGGSKADVTVRDIELDEADSEIAAEAKKGYGLFVIGREPIAQGSQFDPQVTGNALAFAGPIAVVDARGAHQTGPMDAPLNVLVPITGTPVSRRGAELAIALAGASGGRVTALHIGPGTARTSRRWGDRFSVALVPDASGQAAIREIVELGTSYRVEVRGLLRERRTAEAAIKEEIERGGFNLLAIGVSPRPGEQLFFGDVAAALLEQASCSVVFFSSEPVATNSSKSDTKSASNRERTA
ncbi:MAG TPA: cation:proton antiporter [Steroidobacteraceae bacterium]|nr:cation:proton antiporter [Steroidobacteraceae bacterium]